MSPTLRQLEYIVAIADEGSFSAAARACGVSQPGLSAQVIRLEEVLDVSLFELRPRSVVPTRTGLDVIEAARAVLAAHERLVGLARASQDPLAGTIHLGVIPTIAPYLLPRIMPSLGEAFPDLRLLLREERTETLRELLLAGDLDLALVALEADLDGLVAEALGRDAFLLAVPQNHHLASRRHANAEDLMGEDVLLLDDGHCLREQTRPICDAAGACELGDFRATSLSTLIQMIAAGVGSTLLPEMAVKTESGGLEEVAVVPFSDDGVGRTIALVWRPSTPHHAAYLRFAETVREAM